MKIINSNLLVIFLISTFLSSCNGKPPTRFGKELLSHIEKYKVKEGSYPNTLNNNLVDKDSKEWDILTNSFFYIVDSSKACYTLKIYNGDGMSDMYDSKTKQWERSDK